MKYAIISDVHGNIHALEAVLADAKVQNVDKFLLIGDYVNMLPFSNEVADCIRALENTVIVRGNGEDYFTNLLGKKPEEMTAKQFRPIYWSYNSLSKENLKYITTLPETATVTNGKYQIHLSHALSLFFRTPPIELIHPGLAALIIAKEQFTHEEYLTRTRKLILSRPEVVQEILEMPKGIYLFGHNHLQFHMEYEGRLFINPGSCGEPLNWDTRASYTILTVNGPGWAVVERRVEYDLDLAIKGLDTSGFTAYAPAWSEVIKLDLATAKDYFYPFVKHVVDTGHKMGETGPMVSNTAWEVAVATWCVPSSH